MLLRNSYNKNISILNAKREKVSAELTQLMKLRQTVIEKNMKGIYSDDVYMEQNKILGNKINTAETLLNSTIFEKYSIGYIENFMRDKFKDLGQTFDKSKLGEQRVLLGSIFLNGLHWNYNGYSNREIGPLYQSIRDIETSHFALSTLCRIRTRDL